MKHLASLLTLLFAFAWVPCATAQAEAARIVESPPPSLLEGDGPLFAPRHIACNMTAAQVIDAMHGGPDQKPADDLWVYWHFHPAIDRTGKFNTLVVYFNGQGRVSKFRLVERKALAALLQEVRRARAGAVVAQ